MLLLLHFIDAAILLTQIEVWRVLISEVTILCSNRFRFLKMFQWKTLVLESLLLFLFLHQSIGFISYQFSIGVSVQFTPHLFVEVFLSLNLISKSLLISHYVDLLLLGILELLRHEVGEGVLLFERMIMQLTAMGSDYRLWNLVIYLISLLFYRILLLHHLLIMVIVILLVLGLLLWDCLDNLFLYRGRLLLLL
jgi:hypothetical protein